MMAVSVQKGMTTQSQAVAWEQADELPDQLPDDDAAAGCTRPDNHGRRPSVNGFRQPGRAGFTMKQSRGGDSHSDSQSVAAPANLAARVRTS